MPQLRAKEFVRYESALNTGKIIKNSAINETYVKEAGYRRTRSETNYTY